MNKYIISIGSNENREVNMALCRDLLSELYSEINFSEMLNTSPCGEGFYTDFFNQLASICTDDVETIVSEKLKAIEIELGRTRTDKSRGIVKIDLDIIMHNDRVVKQDDFDRPYLPILINSLNKKD